MEIVTLIAGKIWDSLFDPLGRQLGYLVHYNDNIENFRNQTEKLGDMRERVQGQIDVATRNAELVETDVQKWLANVDKAIDAKNPFVEEAEANKSCLNGWCINLRSRYKFSKRAKKETDAITKLQESGKFEKVARPAPPPGIIFPTTKISGAFESRRSIMKQVMETLIDENIDMIGICGMGGIGKTTMVKEVGKQAKEDKIFDEVVMAVVSQTPNLAKIQEEIASNLGLEFKGTDRAGSLWQRIKQNRILVILDDVWGRLELDEVGIPYGKDHEGCKIVLTSRSQIVCNQMDAQKIFSVGALTEEESWSLFRNTAGEIVDSVDINPIATEVVAECGGLPIAILTIGRALRNKNKQVWTDANRQLKKSVPTNIPGMQANVLSTLTLSYDYLESKEAKSLFLLCCLYPEDFDIPVEELVSYGMGLQSFQNVDTVEDARGSARSLVDILISSFLLLEDTYTVEECVKMHDVVRDVAIDIVKDDFLVKAGIGLIEWPNMNTFDRFTAISLMNNDIHEQLPNGLECSRLQTLLLQCNFWLENIPSNFFQEMKDLRVLDMTNNHLISLPPSIQFLSELRTLCLCSSDKLDDIYLIGKLNKLQILRLSGNGITSIPEDFSLLSQLRLLDLKDCYRLTHISPGVISSLHKLEELHMSANFEGWDEEQSRSNASLFELKSLTRLTVLNNIRISDVRFLPNELEFQKLTRYHISIGTKNLSSYWYSRNLKLTHDMSIPLLDCINKLLKRVEGLCLEKCTGLRNMFCDLDNNKFIELKSLQLRHCNEMVYFSELPAESSFSNLREITVMHCPKMQLLQRLQSLEEVSVELCDSLVCVFEVKRGVIAKEETKFLSMLKKLKLTIMPEMTHIWRGSTQFVSLCNLKDVTLEDCKKLRIVFPAALVQDLKCLEDLVIRRCDSLEEIFGKQEGKEGKEIVVWKNDPNVLPCFNNLTRVSITTCGELRILFTHSIAKGLVKLQKLYLKSCEKLQEIVGNEEQGEASSTEKIMFPHLHSVRLKGLPSLASFCSKHYTIEWPALDDLEIIKCPKMEVFGSGLQVTPKLKKVSWMGDRNSTVHHIFIKGELLQRLQSLEEVSVKYCDSLVCVFEVETKFLSMLKRLFLTDLPEMTHIWRGSTQFVSLCNLKDVTLFDCKKLRIVFPAALVQDLICLEDLYISSCDSLEEIFGKQEGKEGKEIVVWKNDPNVLPCFNNLTYVEINKCGELRILFTHSIAKGLVQLQTLCVKSCEKLQEIVGNEEQGEASSTEKIMFPHLQSVTLISLPSLTSFCSKHYTIEWPALDDLEIIKCPKMEIFGSGLQVTPKLKTIRYAENYEVSWMGDRNSTVHHIFIKGEIIVPLQLLLSSQSLEDVFVQDCDSLVCAFEVERGVIEKEETKFLSMLKSIDLRNLPEMTHIWRGSTQFVSLCNLKNVSLEKCKKLRTVFPAALVQDLICLEDLVIWSCDSLEEIFGKQDGKEGKEIVVWKNDPNVLPCFNNLTSIRITKCGELRILFTHSIAKGLVQLQRLFVADCEKLQEIVGNEEQGEASSTEKIMFPHLQSVTRISLPSHTSFCSKHYTIEWPTLDDLHIIECPKMEIFGSGLQVTPKLKKVWYGYGNEEYCWMGDLNSTVLHIFKEEELARQQS